MDGTVSVMAAQYSAEFNIAAAILADPGDPDTYTPERIADPALASLQAKVVSVESAPEFDETYAWKMGGRLRIELADGRTLERTVHGQKGSMHAPLSAAELDAKFAKLVAGRVTDVNALAAAIRNLRNGAVTDLPTALAK